MVKKDKEEILDDEEETTVESESPIPDGYLSIEEIAKEYPDFTDRVENSFKMVEGIIPTKPTMRVMVYIDEPAPLKARILSSDTVEFLPNRKPISMFAMDVLNLVGEPKYRFDLTEAPKELNIMSDNWGAMKRQTLEYSFRVSQHAGRGKKMARYEDKKYTKYIEDNNLMDVIPKIHILVNANVVESVAPKMSLEQRIWEIMQTNNIKANKEKYSDDEVKKIAAAIEQEAHVYGMENMLKGKNSHAHIRYFIKAACEMYAPLPV